MAGHRRGRDRSRVRTGFCRQGFTRRLRTRWPHRPRCRLPPRPPPRWPHMESTVRSRRGPGSTSVTFVDLDQSGASAGGTGRRRLKHRSKTSADLQPRLSKAERRANAASALEVRRRVSDRLPTRPLWIAQRAEHHPRPPHCRPRSTWLTRPAIPMSRRSRTPPGGPGSRPPPPSCSSSTRCPPSPHTRPPSAAARAGLGWAPAAPWLGSQRRWPAWQRAGRR